MKFLNLPFLVGAFAAAGCVDGYGSTIQERAGPKFVTSKGLQNAITEKGYVFDFIALH